MSFLKTKIAPRLGGTLFKSMMYFCGKHKPDAPLEKALFSKRKTIVIGYFFGGRSSRKSYNEYYMSFYNVLCDLFTYENDESLFDFNGIRLPKPVSKNDQFSFALETADFIIYYLVNDVKLCDAVTGEGPYELGNVNIKANDIVIDCGANIGLFSALASHKGATVYAFEPNEYVIDNYLSVTAAQNPNTHICKYALSNAVEKLTFILSGNIGSGTLSITGTSRDIENPTTTVQAVTLDSFIHDNNLPRIDFIKADIEGAERYMLMGAKQAIKEFAPKIAICTYHLPDDPKVLRELILDANPNYIIEEKFQKMYAYVPK